MATQTLPEKIQTEILQSLKDTPYESTSLTLLTGGSANFTYRATLTKPLEDGIEEVIIKHGEPYMAVAEGNKMPLERCEVEAACLKLLGSLKQPSKVDTKSTNSIVRTPKVYSYNEDTHTLILEYFPHSIDLRKYLTETLTSPTPISLRPQFHELGQLLALYINDFFAIANKDAELKQKLKCNEKMQALKHMINYDWMIARVDEFPEILGDTKGVFGEVKSMALRELEDEGRLGAVHGDWWPGNILFPSAPLTEGAETPVFALDWENAQLGVPALDHGEMLGELYVYHLFGKSEASLWMLQGYAEGLGEKDEVAVWRTILQVGVHLLAFGSLDRGFGTREQIENVARTGREVVVNAWKKNRAWFEGHELKCLFASVVPDHK